MRETTTVQVLGNGTPAGTDGAPVCALHKREKLPDVYSKFAPGHPMVVRPRSYKL